MIDIRHELGTDLPGNVKESHHLSHLPNSIEAGGALLSSPALLTVSPTNIHIAQVPLPSANNQQQSLVLGVVHEKAKEKEEMNSAVSVSMPAPNAGFGVQTKAEELKTIVVNHGELNKSADSNSAFNHKGKKDHQYCAIAKRHVNLGYNPKVNLYVALCNLGLSEDRVEAVVFGTPVERVEDALDYLAKDHNGLWMHRFISETEILHKFPETPCRVCKHDSPVAVQDTQAAILHTQSRPGKVMPIDTQFIQFLRRGLAMKNPIYLEASKRRLSRRQKAQNVSELEVNQTTDQKPMTSPLNASTNVQGWVQNEICFICREELEDHSPDYNLELLPRPDTQIEFSSKEPSLVATRTKWVPQPKPGVSFLSCDNTMEQSCSKGDLPTSRATEESKWEPEVRCGICLENESPILHLQKLSCDHLVCKNCMRRYVKLCIQKQKRGSIPCPVYKCPSIITNTILTQYLTQSDWAKYREWQIEVGLARTKRLRYCPRCATEQKFKQPIPHEAKHPYPQTPECFVQECIWCQLKICGLCGSRFHEGMSCAERLNAEYNKFARGREWQLCPSCKAAVRKPSQCWHMTCSQCRYAFCAVCRKQTHPAPSNPVPGSVLSSEFGCCFEKKQVASYTFVKGTKRVCCFGLLCLLLILLSPFIALFFLPYIVARNVAEYVERRSPRKRRTDLIALKVSTLDATVDQPMGKTKMSFLANDSGWIEQHSSGTPVAQSGSGSRCACFKGLCAGLGTLLLFPLSILGIIIVAFISFFKYIKS